MYRPAEFVTFVCCRRRCCFKRARTLNPGSEGATGSFDTTLKYIKVGFARRVFRPLLLAPRQNQCEDPGPARGVLLGNVKVLAPTGPGAFGRVLPSERHCRTICFLGVLYTLWAI